MTTAAPLTFTDALVRDRTLTTWERLEAAWDHIAVQAAYDAEAGALDTAAIFEMPPGRTARRFEVALVVAS